MKRSIVKTAKTKDEAIKEALKEINKSIDEVEIDVLEEESTGFLGLIGQKDAVVKVSYQEDINEGIDSLIKEIEEDTKKDLEKEFDVKKISEEIQEENREDIEESKSLEPKLEDEKESLDLEVKNEEDKEDEVSLYYKAKDLLEKILIDMHFEDVKVIGNLEDNIIKLEAKIDPKDTGIVIGKGGKTLDAIETVIRKIIKARSNKVKLNIDINNYKKRRDEKIIMLADQACKKVLKTRKSWNLKYMNSYERRLAHEQISKYDKLDSHSEGVEPKRFVVVDYK
ncbi:RNA-binding cell elongation regulator Jag/EloR [Anaerococcus hydrogenalis]|uniref:RNA-binding protein KhpB n=1 Tax=Anaerococcus hydrogenalis TaxID=33029 RepID=A0A2N6UHI2_9FIRM|nr:RNA-binding cell elongation regulator Jag/EloR [Anaerococcus hydrogenalis]MDK7695541.1 RNA-binding cell elongation regulator Jag/EloR [Anaerococcus hydrogenalis]MDK7697229.1 RNA-binding cell elongation regulator Jag/EloR [Anaerococcus hydrogenalis]MDK7708568.1 RNA-binding cell elongation regulator Jag/EloR [Anaerococcus hydrogenalis]PMC80998.1 RNA-binding protein [Anaerococcus hydrogenalis]